MHLEPIFSSFIGVHQVDAKVVDSTLMAVRQWETTESYKKYLQYSEPENLNTTYHTYHDILSEIKLDGLREEITNVVREYAMKFGVVLEKIRLDSWINYFKPDNYEAEHNHFGNFISGVYYVQAMPSTGSIEFYEPAKQKALWNSLYTPMEDSVQYAPKTGKLLLFPSYIDHSVNRNLSASTRISIAFNVPLEK